MTIVERCKDCRAPIYWERDTKGHRVPRDPDGTSHLKTCPARAKPRKRGRRGHPIGDPK